MFENQVIKIDGFLYTFFLNLNQSLLLYSRSNWLYILYLTTILLFLQCIFINTNKLKKKYLVSTIFFSDVSFITIICFSYSLLRVHTFIMDEFNIDEGFFITSSATLLNNPMIYKTVEGTTSGMLNLYGLFPIYYLGSSFNYSSLRLFGVLFCMLPSIIFCYLALCKIINKKIARLFTSIFFLVLGSATDTDFLAFTSEQLSILVFSIIFFLISNLHSNSSTSWKTVVLAAILIGLLPYFKLQAILFSGCFGLIFLIIIISKDNILFYNKILLVIIFGFLAIFPTIIFIALFYWNDVLESFYKCYIEYNLLVYVDRGENHTMTFFQKFKQITAFYFSLVDLKNATKIILSLCFLCYIILFTNYKKISKGNKLIIIYTFLLLIASLYSITAPGNPFRHYLLFTFMPALIHLSIVVNTSISIIKISNKNLIDSPLFINSFVVVIFVLFVSNLKYSNKNKIALERQKYFTKEKVFYAKSPLAVEIGKYANPGESMIIWGSFEKLFVETGLYQGGHCTNAFSATEISPLQNYFLDRTSNDIIVNKPKIFVDMMGFLYMTDTMKYLKYYRYPILKKVIDENYDLKINYNGLYLFTLKQ